MRFFNLRAFLNHLLVSVAIVALFALLILTVWYPSIWSKALGGYDLFITILIVDLMAGPLCMGLAYKTHKSTREKIVDVALILTFQLGFLGYGLWVLEESRPAYIVFIKDRYEAYVVNEIPKDILADAPEYNHIPLTGPVYVGVDLEEVGNDALNYLLSGIDVSADPKWYRAIDQFKAPIRAVRYAYRDLPKSDLKEGIEKWATKKNIDPQSVYFLPVKHRSINSEYEVGFITALLVDDAYVPTDYLQIDPYDAMELMDLSRGSSSEIRPIIELESEPESNQMGEAHRATEAISEEIESIIDGVESGVNHYKSNLIGRDMNLDDIRSKIELRSRAKGDDTEALSEEIDQIIQQEN